MIYVEGLNRRGVRQACYTHINQLPGLVERRFDQRWRSLTVRYGGRDGVEVGSICRVGSRRVWWISPLCNTSADKSA